MEKNINYEAPEVEIVELSLEGVICNMSDPNTQPGGWGN